jgi:hypothetical protein
MNLGSPVMGMTLSWTFKDREKVSKFWMIEKGNYIEKIMRIREELDFWSVHPEEPWIRISLKKNRMTCVSYSGA